MSCLQVLIVFLCFFFSSAWDLSFYNISSTYYVSSVAVFGNRAFLALPRSSCANNISNPTLVEAAWYNEQPIFPRKIPFFLESQNWDDCDHLQDAISLDIETMRPRLWVLDRGNENCAPKIVIYNIFQKINYSAEAPKQERKFNFFLVDNDKINGARAYIGSEDVNYLYIFSMNEFKWWKIYLEAPETLLPIATNFLALARKAPVLYLTGGEDRGIFFLNLNELAELNEEPEIFANVTFLGEKLGASSGLVADFKDGLSYYIPRDYVVVRWDSRSPPKAEHYNILAQSYDLLSYVSQLYTGPQNGIWAVSNPTSPKNCLPNPPLLKKRLIKILKYNILM